jgi:hypothetical protein
MAARFEATHHFGQSGFVHTGNKDRSASFSPPSEVGQVFEWSRVDDMNRLAVSLLPACVDSSCNCNSRYVLVLAFIVEYFGSINPGVPSGGSGVGGSKAACVRASEMQVHATFRQ